MEGRNTWPLNTAQSSGRIAGGEKKKDGERRTVKKSNETIKKGTQNSQEKWSRILRLQTENHSEEKIGMSRKGGVFLKLHIKKNGLWRGEGALCLKGERTVSKRFLKRGLLEKEEKKGV